MQSLPGNYFSFIGLLLNTIGGALYSYVKYQEGERKRRKAESEKHPSMTNLLQHDQENLPNGLDSHYKRLNDDYSPSMNYLDEHQQHPSKA